MRPALTSKLRPLAAGTARLVAAAGVAATVGLFAFGGQAAEDAVEIPAPVIDEPKAGDTATAIFAGGCFWGVQGVFQHVKGVTNAVSGYAGGEAATASYKMIGTGSTGHAEAVEITYRPSEISYGELLHVFFSVAHNPTQLNYQGPDRGTQYRSAIFPLDTEQEQVAAAYIAQLDQTGLFGDKIVTTLEGAKPFYAAEDYHQDFLTLNPTYPYIVFHDLPKLENLRRLFPDFWRDEPVLVMAGRS
jgi:peptide-methionine (S)-S-oxide reductase